MFKKYLKLIIITGLITLLPMVFGLIVWNKLPEQMPSHFGMSGEADGYSSRTFMVFGLPLLMLCAHVFCVVVTLVDPKRKNIGKKPLALLFWIIPAVTLITSAMVYCHAFGRKFNVSVVMFVFLGILYMLLGNWLPKVGHNYSFGIRTPWTLNDEENWHATHRLGGKTFTAAGQLMIILALLCIKFRTVALIAMIAVTVVSVCVPLAYSYVYYLKHGRE